MWLQQLQGDNTIMIHYGFSMVNGASLGQAGFNSLHWICQAWFTHLHCTLVWLSVIAHCNKAKFILKKTQINQESQVVIIIVCSRSWYNFSILRNITKFYFTAHFQKLQICVRFKFAKEMFWFFPIKSTLIPTILGRKKNNNSNNNRKDM